MARGHGMTAIRTSAAPAATTVTGEDVTIRSTAPLRTIPTGYTVNPNAFDKCRRDNNDTRKIKVKLRTGHEGPEE